MTGRLMHLRSCKGNKTRAVNYIPPAHCGSPSPAANTDLKAHRAPSSSLQPSLKHQIHLSVSLLTLQVPLVTHKPVYMKGSFYTVMGLNIKQTK